MTMKSLSLFSLALLTAGSALAQPSFEAPPPSRAVVQRADARRAAYLDRVNEVLDWYHANIKPGPALSREAILIKLLRHEDADLCSRSVIEMMKDPGTGPFWMFPMVALSYLGQDQLSPAAQASIREM